jgi:hypothetical protein
MRLGQHYGIDRLETPRPLVEAATNDENGGGVG